MRRRGLLGSRFRIKVREFWRLEVKNSVVAYGVFKSLKEKAHINDPASNITYRFHFIYFFVHTFRTHHHLRLGPPLKKLKHV